MAEQQFTIEELQSEIWKDVKDWEGIYSVSCLGRVRRDLACNRTKAGRILKSSPRNGYLIIGFHHNNVRKTTAVHQLVATAFISECPAGMEVNHIKQPKTNNRVENLEYATHLENMRHAERNRLINHIKGEALPRAKIKDADIPRIFELRAKGLLLREIGAIVNLCESAISHILRGKCRRQSNEKDDLPEVILDAPC